MATALPTSSFASSFSRKDAARILRVPVQQIAGWQRTGMVQRSSSFSTRDLAGMRRLRDLRGPRLSSRAIRRSTDAMRSALGLREPLAESQAFPAGARLIFRHGTSLLDPLRQQYCLDFAGEAKATAPTLICRQAEPEAPRDFARAQDLFQQAVLLEERTETMSAAADLYREVLVLWPTHAPASVNLGTILYNQQRYAEAEARYQAAAEMDPEYALAFFDLGNVLDELQRLPEAIAAYLRALQLVPQYADAHYNLALAYERTGERRRALRHWMHYVRLDPVGPWASHARTQAKKALQGEKLSIVSRYGRLAS